MARKITDRTGERYGKLVALRYLFTTPSPSRAVYWEFQCDCGNKHKACISNVRAGKTLSCGCLNKKHGFSKTRLYNIWSGMKIRCYNQDFKWYYNYGGKGVYICYTWLNDFLAFRTWALANNYSDDLTIDRIDNDKPYCPANCRWATRQEQSSNRSQVSIKNKTGYKGVFKAPSGNFRATIVVNYQNILLGTFDTAELAAKAYNDFIKKHDLPHSLNVLKS
jgi:hypothetical protein